MMPGAATATVTSPRPERTRVASRAAPESTVAPQTEPTVRRTSPAARTRRTPSRSAASPLAMPMVAPTRLKIEATHPPATRPRSSSSRRAGSAGGTLPTWSEAATPLAIMTLTTSHRVVVARSAGRGIVAQPRPVEVRMVPVPVGRLLVGVADAQHAVLVEGLAVDHQPDRQPARGEAAGHAQPAQVQDVGRSRCCAVPAGCARRRSRCSPAHRRPAPAAP